MRIRDVIHAKGYETTLEELQAAGEFAPGLLAVLVAKPTDLGNGFRCANVLFFANGEYAGRDSTTCHLYPQISWGNDAEISVVYPRYAQSDATCCPTLDPKRVIFRLTHGQMGPVSSRPPSS